MNKAFKDAIVARRSNYSLTNKSTLSDREIEELVDLALQHVPSAFNSQSTRIVLLLNEHHQKFWNIVKQELKKVASEEGYLHAEAKIDHSLASGYGTILFFEDERVVKGLQENFAPYADHFPKWAQQTSAMHQYVLWVGLADAGLGASIQHYNPVIDDAVRQEWNIDENWTLIAQMPFGVASASPEEKPAQPLNGRIKVFK